MDYWEKTFKILLSTEFMSNFIGIPDPVSLDLPELGLNQGGSHTPPVLEGGCDRRWRRRILLSCMILAAVLHGTVVFLAFTLVMGVSAPDSSISISLLSAMRSGGANCDGAPLAAQQDQPPAAKRKPVSTRQAEPAKSRGTAKKPGTPLAVEKVPASVQGIVKKPVSAPATDIRPGKELRDHGLRTESETGSASAPEEATQISDLATGDQVTGEAGPDAGSEAQQVVASGAGETSRASGTPGAIGAQALGGTGWGDGPVGASFGDADGPRFVQRVMPRYPELARRRGREGLVLLRLTIGPRGELRDVAVVESGGQGFDEAALAAVKASVYAPAMRGGRGVECAALLPIRFTLKGS
jgi:protein TonB